MEGDPLFERWSDSSRPGAAKKGALLAARQPRPCLRDEAAITVERPSSANRFTPNPCPRPVRLAVQRTF